MIAPTTINERKVEMNEEEYQEELKKLYDKTVETHELWLAFEILVLMGDKKDGSSNSK